MTELTDRMRTCAAFLLDRVQDPVQSDNPVAEILRATRDAVDLLIEAANLLDDAVKVPEPAMLGSPMEILKPYPFTVSMPAPPVVEVGQRAGLPTDQTPETAPKSVAPPNAGVFDAPLLSPDAAWVAPGGPLPGVKASGTRSQRSCPQCGSFGYKRVFRRDRQMYLHCGVCSHEWKFELARHA